MNKVFLIGNLTKDPEASTIANGTKYCRFSIAVNRNYNSTDGTRQTDFFQIVCWRNTAENCAKFLKKGKKVAIAGSIQTRSFDANDGTKRYVTEIQADEVQFLSAKGESESQEFEDSFDNVETLPEAKSKKRIEELKPVDGGDLPF